MNFTIVFAIATVISFSLMVWAMQKRQPFPMFCAGLLLGISMVNCAVAFVHERAQTAQGTKGE